MEYMERNCRICRITLSKFEEEEYVHHCIDCYKEEHKIESTNKESRRPVLIRSGRKRIFTA